MDAGEPGAQMLTTEAGSNSADGSMPCGTAARGKTCGKP
jgi:hypothetical protein